MANLPNGRSYVLLMSICESLVAQGLVPVKVQLKSKIMYGCPRLIAEPELTEKTENVQLETENTGDDTTQQTVGGQELESLIEYTERKYPSKTYRSN